MILEYILPEGRMNNVNVPSRLSGCFNSNRRRVGVPKYDIQRQVCKFMAFIRVSHFWKALYITCSRLKFRFNLYDLISKICRITIRWNGCGTWSIVCLLISIELFNDWVIVSFPFNFSLALQSLLLVSPVGVQTREKQIRCYCFLCYPLYPPRAISTSTEVSSSPVSSSSSPHVCPYIRQKLTLTQTLLFNVPRLLTRDTLTSYTNTHRKRKFFTETSTKLTSGTRRHKRPCNWWTSNLVGIPDASLTTRKQSFYSCHRTNFISNGQIFSFSLCDAQRL